MPSPNPNGGRLEGKTAVIGGGSGFAIGRASVRLFLQEGASVLCMDRKKDERAGRQFVEDVSAEFGREVGFSAVDPLDPETICAALELAFERSGRLDVLFNLLVAGRTRDPHDWQWTLNSPFAPTYFGTHFAAEIMSRHGGGSIINASSVSGVVLSPSIRPLPPLSDDERDTPLTVGAGSYGAAKATIAHLSREFAVRYAKRGIRVNVIAPGFLATPYTLSAIEGDYRQHVEESIPMGHLGEATDIANAALFFASDESRYVTGQLIVVDGGFSARGH